MTTLVRPDRPEDDFDRLRARVTELEAMLDARAAARASRDWPESDRLRDELLARGVAVEDTRDGQRWRLLVTSGG